MRVVDFRSDTVTHPTPEMRNAMAEAEVGDDVQGEDPTVNRLESMAAEKLGKEAAVFVASGTMGNLVSVLAHAQRGDEIILGDKSHIFRAEAGGVSALGGVAFHTLPNNERGMLDPNQVESELSPNNIHYANTAVVALENTHNACGGAILSPGDIKSIGDIVHNHNIPLHIDGARIFNAAVALETPVSELVKNADSITFCLSKGLGCPVGSVICGTQEYIEKVRKWRKIVGGAMRQAGIIAAAGVVALDTMINRMAEDHANARKLANGLRNIPGISIEPDKLPTNLVFFDITQGDSTELSRALNARGIKGGRPGQSRWRFVTHNDVSSDDIDYALNIVDDTFREHAKSTTTKPVEHPYSG